MKEYTADDLRELIADYYEESAPDVIAKLNRWLARGDGVAVYRNNELGHPNMGEPQIMSFGSPAAQFEVPPEQLPDMGSRINWRFGLEGTYRGEVL